MARSVTALQDELRSVFARGVDSPLPEAEFNRLALDVFTYQFERNRPYQAYCRARRKTPGTVTAWIDIPALPTAAFKEADLTTLAPDEIAVTYYTSGTTHQGARRGRHLLPDTELYDASAIPNFRAHLLPDVDQIRVLICGPSLRYFPNSSLGHMNSAMLERFGASGSGIFWQEDGPRFGCLAAALSKAEADQAPVCLLGTAFGLVHFLDWMQEQSRTFRLPSGSRLMDTGGYKGRSREVPKSELYALYTERLGIAPTHVVNEYGMTELGSQFYDSVLREWAAGQHPDPAADQRRKVPAPWVRTVVVDADTLAPAAPGEIGLLRHYDLANLYSVLAVQTDDLGVKRADGFEVLGRAAGAEPRGCSLAVEEFLDVQGR